MQDIKDLILSVLCYGTIAVTILFGVWSLGGAFIENIKDRRKDQASYGRIFGTYVGKVLIFLGAVILWMVVSTPIAFLVYLLAVFMLG